MAASSSSLHAHMLFLLARWRVALVALPVAAVCGGVRFAIWRPNATLPTPLASGWFVDTTVLTGFISASIFVLAILLNGIMADYKESERIPGEIESGFQAVLAHVLASARIKKFKPAGELRALRGMLRTVARCVNKSAPYAVCARELMALDVELVAALDAHGAMIPNVTNFTSVIRSRMGRAHVIADTDFLLPFYSLFDALVALVLILLVVTNFSTQIVGVTNASVFSFLFVYLGVLVRDLDDPFGYPTDYLEKCLDESRWLPISVSSTMSDASSIDFSILLVSFGGMLNAELERIGEPVAPSPAAASANSIGSAGGSGSGGSTSVGNAAAVAAAAAAAKSSGSGADAGGAGPSGGRGAGEVVSLSDMVAVVP